MNVRPLEKDLFYGAVDKYHCLTSKATPMEVVLSSPLGAIAAWVVLCRCFHLGIIHSAVVNGWHDRLVHILCTTPLISWKSEYPSTVAVLYFSKYVSDIYRLKQLLVNGYKLLFSAISCAFFFSLYQICVTK